MGAILGTQTLPTFPQGKQLVEGTDLNNIVKAIFGGAGLQNTIPAAQGSAAFINLGLSGYLSLSVTTGVTAHAGGGQTNAVAITTDMIEVTTVATTGDSIVLPASTPGRQITVYNSGANTLAIFPAGTDAINHGTAGASISCAAGKTFILSCFGAGDWSSTLAG